MARETCIGLHSPDQKGPHLVQTPGATTTAARPEVHPQQGQPSPNCSPGRNLKAEIEAMTGLDVYIP